MNIEFKQDKNLRVTATADNGGFIDSQSVEALLMMAILEKLEEIRCCAIDVENEISLR